MILHPSQRVLPPDVWLLSPLQLGSSRIAQHPLVLFGLIDQSYTKSLIALGESVDLFSFIMSDEELGDLVLLMQVFHCLLLSTGVGL